MSKSKYTLELSDRLDEVLEELADREGVTKAQIIRKSIGLLKVVEDNRDQGYVPTLQKAGAPEKQIVV